MAKTLVCFSVSERQARALAADGPRRDIECLARRLSADVLYRRSQGRRRSRWLNRLAGPHVTDAWRAAKRARGYEVVFADGEHVGLPLLLFVFTRRQVRPRVAMIGHLIDRPWKRSLLWLGSRLVPGGVLVVHSVRQQEAARSCIAKTWSVALLPYQVDSSYWTGSPASTDQPLRVLAVGSEHRDYTTLARAVDGLDVEVIIASGSHWARASARSQQMPPNVTVIKETLSFARLRDLYAAADVVVVPLEPVSNQSGVTTILEGMSMSRPVVITATPGQREVITGPLVRATERWDQTATEARGPQAFGGDRDPEPTGLYVAPGDADGLREALRQLRNDGTLRARLAAAGRASVERNFTIEQFVERFAEALEAPVTAG